ncbi:methyltransferase family protein [Chloroflexota bacterium]
MGDKREVYVSTTRIVDTGIYALVRHPQYNGGIYSIFLTTLLWYPHWLFALLGVIGTAVIYLSVQEADRKFIEKFGDEYTDYMSKVPAMNVFLGIARALQSKRA